MHRSRRPRSTPISTQPAFAMPTRAATRVPEGCPPGRAGIFSQAGTADAARKAGPDSFQSMKLTINVDGGARGNPGPAAIGIVVRDPEGEVITDLGETIGDATNNVAEYKALIRGIRMAVELGADELEIRGDSELVVKQMLGQYKVKHPDLRLLFAEVMKLRGKFERLSFTHVPRSQNKEADRLVNEKLNAAA